MDLLAIDLDFDVSESKLERNKRLKQKVSIETDGWTPRVQCFGVCYSFFTPNLLSMILTDYSAS